MQHNRTARPITCLATWTDVMVAADWQCQCTGQCGGAHARCPAGHSALTRLVAAPEDPALPPLEAARLPLAELRAWCPGCHRDAVRRSRREARQAASEAPADTLF